MNHITSSVTGKQGLCFLPVGRAQVLLSSLNEEKRELLSLGASPKREFLFLLVGLETLFKRVRRYGRE